MYKQSILEGLTAEKEFSRLAKLRGFKVEPATGMEQFDHIDFHLTSDEEDGIMTAMVDVKSRKRISRSDESFHDELVWIEFKNVRGKDGWLYGLADFIAFEIEDSFILSFRKELVDWCESRINIRTKVLNPEDALYSGYSRKGKQDLLSLIKMRDIEKLPNTAIWEK